ncbi:glycosyltransferase family 2 protein [Acinetobacter sp. ME22]|uniref:glycosyltransferase family 2 protein n=1 Tax=Acinetobacter sp. ME22 TaxID=2904802 RepID=UPI001EDABD7D|nr:glycosyltransferase family 2 protein [Acinetobacter sp. ME22]
MKICAIIVTFDPEISSLIRLIGVLKQQSAEIVVIDNNSKNKIQLESIPHIYLECLSQNVGIAAAQNIGINKILALAADYVVFFDQDSQIDSYFIPQILHDYLWVQQNQDAQISMIGPRLFNMKNQQYYKIYRLSSWGFKKAIPVSDLKHPIRVDSLISSGSFLSVDTLKKIGEMKSHYFIDYVDIEWSFRHLSQGFHLYVSHTVVMNHQIGEENIALPFGKKIIIHPAFRRYYRVRNSFYLLKESYIPKIYALNEIMSGLIYQLCIIWYCKKQKKQQIDALFRAVKDGLSSFFKHT